MTPRSSYTAARAPYTGLRPAFEALMRKKDASLSGGAYARDPRPGVTSTVRAANRSRFHALADAEAGDGQLGMGIVQGILAALTGAVRAISWDSDGGVGRVTIDGVGSRETYQMSWDDRREDYLLLGGFVNGATYQATLVGLTLLWAQRAINPRRTDEVLERWWTLLHLMDTQFVREDRIGGWDASQVRAACQDTPKNAAIRDAIEALADALHVALRYRLPALTERGLYVQYESCATGSAGTHASAPGAALLALPVASVVADPPPPTPEVVPEPVASSGAGSDEDDDLDLDHVPDGEDVLSEAAASTDGTTSPRETREAAAPSSGTSAASAAPSTVDAPSRVKRTRSSKTTAGTADPAPRPNTSSPAASMPPARDVSLVGGVVQERIRRAFARTGDVFLYGVTATGKTSWAKQAAIAHGYGLEIVVFKPGVKDEMLYGTSVQDLTGRWVWQDGPIVRAARRASAGERIVLLLDELPRGDKSVVAGTMDLLNVYSAADLLAQRLPLPTEPGPYRIIRVFDTQETLVFAAQRVKIVATANLGDKYQGLDLSDPAFRRRWSGGWLELEGYSFEETAHILAGHLEIAASHALIRAMINVDRDVQALQRKDESLVMTTNLATLITWGTEVLRLAAAPAAPRTSGRPDIRMAFVVAAQDLFLDMLCPVNGDRRDPEVYRELLAIVQRHTPGVL